MSHTNRTAAQQRKFNLLKHALNGDGASLDQIVSEGDSPAFGSDYHFHEVLNPGGFNAEGSWEEIDSETFEIVGGRYSLDYMVKYNVPSATKLISTRLVIDGVPLDQIDKESADNDDTIVVTIIDEHVFVGPAQHTIALEMFQETTGQAQDIEVLIYRTRTFKVANT